jgi:hypothetical protein
MLLDETIHSKQRRSTSVWYHTFDKLNYDEKGGVLSKQ